MKTRTKVTIVASAAILLAGVGIASVTEAHGEKGEHRGGAMGKGMGMGKMGKGMMGKGPHGARAMMGMFDAFDGNSDGAVTQAEIDEFRTARLVRFDTDGNGSLDLKEYEALWLDAAREHMVDRFQDLDADGDGIVTQAEFSKPFSGMVKVMDRNGDGAVSREDMGHHGGKMDKDNDDS